MQSGERQSLGTKSRVSGKPTHEEKDGLRDVRFYLSFIIQTERKKDLQKGKPRRERHLATERVMIHCMRQAKEETRKKSYRFLASEARRRKGR